MYLSENRSRSLSEAVALLASAASREAMLEGLAAPLSNLMDADYLVSRTWSPVTGQFEICVAHNMDPDSVRAYHDHFQFCDPVTPRLRMRRQATLVSEVLPPAELQRTEFYNDFLRAQGMHWGLNLYAYDGDECVGDLVIFRPRARENFTRGELSLLGVVAPAFTSALVRLKRAQARAAEVPVPAVPELPAPQALAERAHLSLRESEVVLLVARGQADKEIARALGISFTTVRYHLENAFRKLGVQGRHKLALRLREFA